MANSYNSMPIVINATMSAGWRSLQTLNTGTNATGIRVFKVIWDAPSTVGNTFEIVDPVDSTVLLTGTCSVASQDIQYNFDENPASWRDFKVTTLSSGTLYIWYRA